MVGKVTSDTVMSASRLPALFGVSKYSTPNDELRKSIAAMDGIERENVTNEAMGWGNVLEPLILREAVVRLGLDPSQAELDWPEAQRHPEWPFQCSLDGTIEGDGQQVVNDKGRGIFVIGSDSIFLEGRGILEAKLTRVWPELSPAIYRGPLQLQGQMAIMGATWGAVCVLYQGVELRVFLFEQDLRVQESIHDAVWEFDAKLSRYYQTGDIDLYQEATK
jgi:hypothetical protein